MAVNKFISIVALLFVALLAQSSSAAVIGRFPTKAVQNRGVEVDASLSNAKRMALGLPLNPPSRRATEHPIKPPHPSTTPKPPYHPPPPPPKPPVKPPPPPKPPVKPPPPPKPPVKPPPPPVKPPPPPVKPPHP